MHKPVMFPHIDEQYVYLLLNATLEVFKKQLFNILQSSSLDVNGINKTLLGGGAAIHQKVHGQPHLG